MLWTLFLRSAPNVKSDENFKPVRTNGSHVGLESVLFVTQPKLRLK